MSNNTGGPAFPFCGHVEGAYGQADGMTLRDYFAAKAMEALLSDHDVDYSPEHLAEMSYARADAMLKERAK